MDEKSDFLTLSPTHVWGILAQRVRAGHTQIQSILHEHGLDLAFVWPGSACPDRMELPARTQRTSQMGEVAKAVDLDAGIAEIMPYMALNFEILAARGKVNLDKAVARHPGLSCGGDMGNPGADRSLSEYAWLQRA